ncbi:MAG TPA: glycosyltransferase family 4 protein [Candidatus Saccharimonadales bacterium]|nr:glycosyltransferase family 4 protein [Candidatus Saccharimonadales bacterium]
MVRIALFSAPVLEFGGGLEKYYIETAAELAKQDGTLVDVVTMDDDFINRLTSFMQLFYMKRIDKKANFKESLTNIRERLGDAGYHKERTIRELRHRLSNYDVVYSKNELLESFMLKVLVGYNHLPPVVLGGHTPLAYPNPQSLQAKVHNFLYASPMYRFFASPANKYHVLNNEEELLYKKIFGPAKVHKIYNPFDDVAFRRQATRYPFNLSLDKTKLHILWAGRLTEQKGVADLARIIEAANNDDVTWTIAGDGDLRPIVEQLAANHPTVTYLGHVDQKYMSSLYSLHDIFLSTSKWEGYPYNLLEAKAWELAIIAYDIPGSSDILHAYGRGYLCRQPEQIVEQLQRWAMHGLEPPPKRVGSGDFGPETVYKQLLQLLNPTN